VLRGFLGGVKVRQRALFLFDSQIGFRNNSGKSCRRSWQEVHMNTEHGWGKLYKAAVLETDWSKMEDQIEAAENGIKARLEEFSMNHGGTPEENQAIEDALNGLATLRKEFATWQGLQRAG
jgi:hypothetical protein